MIFVSIGRECGADACVRDRSVTPREDLSSPAAGYCAVPCGAVACPQGTHCVEVTQQQRLCLHAP